MPTAALTAPQNPVGFDLCSSNAAALAVAICKESVGLPSPSHHHHSQPAGSTRFSIVIAASLATHKHTYAQQDCTSRHLGPQGLQFQRLWVANDEHCYWPAIAAAPRRAWACWLGVAAVVSDSSCCCHAGKENTVLECVYVLMMRLLAALHRPDVFEPKNEIQDQ